MAKKPRFAINRNRDDEDVIHVEHPWEKCNTDDAEGLELIDDKTARALMATEQAVDCQHCKPFSGGDD